MVRSNRRLRFLVSSLAALAALVAVGVSPAIAVEEEAKFSGTSMKMTTAGVTIKKNGADPRSCTLWGGSTQGPISSNVAWLINASPFPVTQFTCTGGNLQASFLLTPKYDSTTGNYILRYTASNSGGGTSPWGGSTATGADFKGTWVNGSGGTPSTVTYSEAVVARLTSTGEPITLSGTFTVTTNSGGGLLTVSK